MGTETANASDMPMGYCQGYSDDIGAIRDAEYPLLKETTYLDHAGTTLYAKSLIDSYHQDLTGRLYGNPHSMSASSQLSSQRVDDIRLRALRFFNASPDEFDLVFVANATAGIKLVADAFRDLCSPSTPDQGFWYGYHVDAHTSLVGARELAATGSRCFMNDEEVETWIAGLDGTERKFSHSSSSSYSAGLFAYPAQSNMNGRRLPISWCEAIRQKTRDGPNIYTLLDAASLVSTSPLDLRDSTTAPDFTVLSFYKIFGFPDLGALIVRKGAAHIFEKRKFFGGGTVDMVLAEAAPGTSWHAKKQSSIHDQLEDGTLPFHSIFALDSAFETHSRLYGSMENIYSHTRCLAQQLYFRMDSLKHFNGEQVCQFYKDLLSDYADPSTQGPIIAFNLRNSRGMWVGKSEVERLASIKNIQIRSGTLCNPGGTAVSLGWTGADMLRHFSAGLRCGDDHDIMDGRPTGILRISLGAMSSMQDINNFISFLQEFYVERKPESSLAQLVENVPTQEPSFYIESLSVFPIKSCGAFKVPDGQRWDIKREGLAWDREWCLVHQGTGATLNQKRYPRMALIRPTIDLGRGVLCITTSDEKSLEIPLHCESTGTFTTTSLCQNTSKPSTVCGDRVILQSYTSSVVSDFFTSFLGVPCTLARFPPQTSSSTRFSGPRRTRDRQHPTHPQPLNIPGAFPQSGVPSYSSHILDRAPILLANESPLLLVSRSSVNRLNEAIKFYAQTSGTGDNNGDSNYSPSKAVAADVFRANIVVAENFPTAERPYIEDTWQSLSIGPDRLRLDVLGSCERCQMVCVDQFTGQRREEPYATLAKTRKYNRKILFGRHVSPSIERIDTDYGEIAGSCLGSIMVGDVVVPEYDYE